MPTLPLFLLSVGCFPRVNVATARDDTGLPTGDDTAAHDSADDSGGVPIELDTVSPDEASTAGGRQITLTGAAFGDDAAVWFGEAQAAVRSVSGSTLVVDLPPVANGTGVVAVRVESHGQQATLDDGFRYWDDATDQAIALFHTAWWAPADSAYAGYAESAWITSYLDLIQPADVRYQDAYGPLDSCTAGLLETVPVEGPGFVTLRKQGGSDGLSIPYDDTRGYYFITQDITGTPYPSGDDFALDVGESSLYRDFTAEHVLSAPPTFHVDQPGISSGRPTVDANLHVAWSGSSGDYAVIYVFDQNSDASVRCAVVDDGDFNFDNSSFSGFSWTWDLLSWAYLADVSIYVISYTQTDTILDFNNGEVRAQAGYGQYGWATLKD